MANDDLRGFSYKLAALADHPEQVVTVEDGPTWGDGQYVSVTITEPARTYKSVKQAALVRRHKESNEGGTT